MFTEIETKTETKKKNKKKKNTQTVKRDPLYLETERKLLIEYTKIFQIYVK